VTQVNLNIDSRILVLGSSGLVGSAFIRYFEKHHYRYVLGCSSVDSDLTDRSATRKLISEFRPDLVIMAAGKIGGIRFNIDRARELFLSNMLMQNNVLEASADFGVPRLLFFGSSSVYPALAPQPMNEKTVGTGQLELVLKAFGTVKLAGIELINVINSDSSFKYKTIIAANLYGPNDNFHPIYSHALQGLMRKIHRAKIQKDVEITLWGDGTPEREFLYSDDLVTASIVLLNSNSEDQILNVGTGEEISIHSLASLIAKQVEFKGEMKWDSSSPNGSLRRVLDSSKIRALGWEPKVYLSEGIKSLFEYYDHEYR
jgi:GDP-L-fucose synthase